MFRIVDDAASVSLRKYGRQRSFFLEEQQLQVIYVRLQHKILSARPNQSKQKRRETL